MPAARSAPGTTIEAFLNIRCGNADKAREALVGAGIDREEAEPDKLVPHLKKAIAGAAARIIVAGGDGTIAAAAALVAGTKTELAILPGGTLNHFAKDHGIPVDLDEAAALAAHGQVVGADLGYVNDCVFLNTSSIGAYVTFVRVRERFERTFGYTIASFIALIRVFSSIRTFDVELEVEGQKKSYRSSLVFIGVGERELKLPVLGNRIKNGKRGLHVMIVQGRRPARLFAIAMAGIAKGTRQAAKLPQFDAFLVDRCRIDLRRPSATIALDGELKRLDTPLEYRIERDAIRLVVPAAAEG
ncbi:MAG TPA: diacylglycerol kinase family protein [Gemmatimonadaceae bacterium]|nr:diacylglycerol kinase family protein [Gemmatimonadaceae bacterium]